MTALDPTTPIPVIVLEGDAQARGHAHGRARRQAIEQAIDIYGGVFGLPESKLIERAGHFAAVTRAWSPELADEMDATADGAGVPRHWIHALNARSELVSGLAAEAGECTAVFFAERGLLGQTWDWLEALEPLIAILDVRHPDGHRVLALSEPGILGKIGLSSAGLGVCLNFLRSPHPLVGVPVHALLRGILDLRHPQELEPRLARAGNGRSAHVLVGSASGEGIGLEFTGTTCHRLQPETGVLTHTNHFLREDFEPGPGTPNSKARLSRACQLTGTGDWSSLRGMLSDRGDPEHPITVSWRHMPGWEFGLMGTVCALAMDLRDGILEVRRGPDPDAPWQRFDLHDRHLKLAASDSFGTA